MSLTPKTRASLNRGGVSLITSSSAVEPTLGRLPLCTRYASVHAGLLRRQAKGIGTEHASYAPWAIGVTLAGEPDVLGAWSQLATELETAEQVVEDLVERGVEAVGVLVNAAGEEFASALVRAYPHAVAIEPPPRLPSECLSFVSPPDRAKVSKQFSALWAASSYDEARAQLAALEAGAWRGIPEVVQTCRSSLFRSQSFFALPLRTRKAALRVDALAARLQDGVSAALRRRCFASPEAAAAFAESWLVAAERRLRSRPAPVRRPRVAAALALPAPG